MSTTNGNRTSFFGPGFGTLTPIPDGDGGAPTVFSSRGHMRQALPTVYQDDELAMRFVGAFECVLDPIAALLDALPEHFRPDYAPRPLLDLLAAWLGVEIEEEQGLAERRDAVRAAARLARLRGTVEGLQLALALNFPGVPIRVEDSGGVRYSLDGAPAQVDGPPQFAVYVDMPLPEERKAAIARCIEREKPVEAGYKLRVRRDGSDK